MLSHVTSRRCKQEKTNTKMLYSFFFLTVVVMHVNNSPKFKYVKAELSEAEASRKM